MEEERRERLVEREKKMRDGFLGLMSEMVEEVKVLSCISGPMVVVNLSQYFLQVISIMMVGHLGKLYLSSTAIAISFCAVTGFSLLVSLQIKPSSLIIIFYLFDIVETRKKLKRRNILVGLRYR